MSDIALGLRRSVNAITLTDTVSKGVMLVAPLSAWAETHGPATATLATATKAAGAAGVRHVCTYISASLHNGGGTFDGRSIRIRDGISGVGTILWESFLGVVVEDGSTDRIEISGLAIIGSAATAMTLEFDSAPSTANRETVSLTGYSVN